MRFKLHWEAYTLPILNLLYYTKNLRLYIFFSFIILLLRNEMNDINFKVRTLCKTSPLCEGCLALSNKESVSRGRP